MSETQTTLSDKWLAFSVEWQRIVQECETIVRGRTYHEGSRPDTVDVVAALWKALKDAESRHPDTGDTTALEIDALERIIKGKDKLLVCYRLGSHKNAESAITMIEKAKTDLARIRSRSTPSDNTP